MTRRIGNVVVIEAEGPKRCDRCGEEKECRDVLGNGSALCFTCATKAEKLGYIDRVMGPGAKRAAERARAIAKKVQQIKKRGKK